MSMNEGKTGRARTIAELAKLAGVSGGTVSRALQGSELISAETRERIAALAREHDFHPNITARNLRIRRTGAIGVVIPMGHDQAQHLSDPFFMAMLANLADGLSERGYNLLLSRVLPADPQWLGRFVDHGQVDGVILIGQSDQSEVIERIAARYRPLVVWGANLPDQVQCTVGTDNHLGGAIAARHLLSRGVASFAFLGDPGAPEIAQRLAGVRDELARSGLDGNLQVLPAHLTAETAHQAISDWLDATKIVPGGIIAASDVIALSALRALAEHEFAVPHDVKVVGYDDLPIADQATPPLTTIRQPIAQGAAMLIDLLFRRLGGEDTSPVVMEPQLIVRASS